MRLWIEVGIGISIGKFFGFLLDTKGIGKKLYRSTFTPNDTAIS